MSRRTLLKAGGLTAAAATIGAEAGHAAPRAPQVIQLQGTAFGTGNYQYHPFRVPSGTNRLDIRIVKNGDAKTGIGLFDQRGSHYGTLSQPNGFRGIYGEERGEFFVAANAASQSFIPGPIEPGEWTVIVPVFSAPTPVPYTIVITVSQGPQGRAFRIGRDLGVVLDQPGWYRGDLHAHTPESSDAWKSGSALSPSQWAQECRRIGLDFLALTDHNVVSQNFAIADSAGEDVLLLAGEEMTNWFFGHATVSGITPGDWFDWRQLPGGQLTAAPDPRSGSIQQFLEAARASGAYVSTAHPLGATLAWRFFPEAALDPAARTDGLEIWTGPFQADDEAMLKLWDQMLVSGQRIVGNGGSDLHGTANKQGFAAGSPTTVVHAAALSKPAVIDALKRGRSFVTRLPDGVEVYLAATGVDGQRQITGGTLYGAPTDLAVLDIVVRRAAGMRLTVIRDGAVALVLPVTADEQSVTYSTPIGAGGFVRVEVRGEPFFGGPTAPLASRTDMEAFTNPVFLRPGPTPAGTQADLTQPPPQAGPRRAGASQVTGNVATGAALLTVAALAPRSQTETVRRISLSELRLRAATGTSLRDMDVVLTGEVTAVRPDGFTITRWAPGCCSNDISLDVEVQLPAHTVAVGTWWQVHGRWVEGTGDSMDRTPVVAADSARQAPDPPARREDV